MMRLTPVLLLALLAGCSSKKEGPGNKLADVGGFCDEWAAHACNDAVVAKCPAPSTSACVDAQRSFCVSLVTPADHYSGRTAEECLNAVGSAYKDAEYTADERDTVRHLGGACSHVLSGPGGVGAACTEDTDCNRDDDLSCVMKGPDGTCQAATPVGGGSDCSPPDATCEDGFYCSADGYCLAGKSEGSTCSPDVRCAKDFQCLPDGTAPAPAPSDGGVDAGSGATTCQAKKTAGEECTSDDECATRMCALGATKGVCASQIPLGPTDPLCEDLR